MPPANPSIASRWGKESSGGLRDNERHQQASDVVWLPACASALAPEPIHPSIQSRLASQSRYCQTVVVRKSGKLASKIRHQTNKIRDLNSKYDLMEMKGCRLKSWTVVGPVLDITKFHLHLALLALLIRLHSSYQTA